MTTTKGTHMKPYRGIKIIRVAFGSSLHYGFEFRLDTTEDWSSGTLAKTKERIDHALSFGATISDEKIVLTAALLDQVANGHLGDLAWYCGAGEIIERDAWIQQKESKHAADLASGKIVVGQQVRVKTWRTSKKHLNGVIGTVIFVSEADSYAGEEAKIKTSSGEIHRVITQELITVKAGA